MSDFILPDIGEGIVECELLEWLVQEGDVIEEDQPVAEVMTDKATVQIPAMHAGVITKLYYKTGDIAKVHAPLFAMDNESDEKQNASSTDSQELEKEQLSESSQASSKEGIEGSSNQSSIDFILPDIGEGIVECEIVKWLVEQGQEVTEDQPVVEVMTDKALVEIPAKYSGTIMQLYYQQGEIAKVHSPLYALSTEESESTGNSQKQSSPLKTENLAENSQPSAAQSVQKNNKRKALASPAVRRLARENNLDITSVSGSGKKGRVLKQDIASHLDNKGESKSNTQTNANGIKESSENIQPNRVEAIRGIKAVMAKQMTGSVFTIPHFSVSDEVEMDTLLTLKTQLKADFEASGAKLSLMPFFIKALSLALKQFPIINSQVNDECTEITYFNEHNIGIAVDSKIGLLVPNIKNVQNLSLFEIALEMDRLVNLAREGKLASNDLKGGTISISNIGVIGGTTATPVINKPESAIVALGKIQRLPRFDAQYNVIPVNLMHISWSGDHRIIDGATMVKFSNLWKSYLENPMSMLSHLR